MRPVILPLSPEALAEFVKFYTEHGHEQAQLTGDIEKVWAKLEGYAARLALIHHCISSIPSRGCDPRRKPLQVGLKSMQAGIRLARWFGAEAERVQRILGEGPSGRERRELVELIANREGRKITTRQLQQARRTYRHNAANARAALDRLVQLQFCRWILDDHNGKGGRPVEVFVLFPVPDNESAVTEPQ